MKKQPFGNVGVKTAIEIRTEIVECMQFVA